MTLHLREGTAAGEEEEDRGAGEEAGGGGLLLLLLLLLLEGRSLIVTKWRSGGDPVATREFSAQHSGKVGFN